MFQRKVTGIVNSNKLLLIIVTYYPLEQRLDMKKQNKEKPIISVVMPVYNAGDFLVESIQSILKQTFKSLEFIIYDDASSDKTSKILKQFSRKDKRVRIFKNERRLGVSATMKKALEKVRGDYIARMDADDIAMSRRLEKQINYLKNHERTVAIGAQCYVIDKKGKVIGKKKFPTNFEQIHKYIFKLIPLQQPTLMIAKKRLPRQFEFYRDGMNTAEEVELLFKLFQYGKVENLNSYLLKYRMHDKNTSLKSLKSTFFLTLYSRILGVVKYGCRPDLEGVVATLLQAIMIVILPNRLLLYIYTLIKDMRFKKEKTSIKKGILIALRISPSRG